MASRLARGRMKPFGWTVALSKVIIIQIFALERAKGIEPSYEAWEASVLPLNYARERRWIARFCGSWGEYRAGCRVRLRGGLQAGLGWTLTGWESAIRQADSMGAWWLDTPSS